MKRINKYNYLSIVTFLIIVVLTGSIFSQHHHYNNDTLFTEIFSNGSPYGEISVFSSNYPLIMKENIDLRLIMSMKDTSMKLNIEESKIIASKMDNRDIYYLNFRTGGENKDMFSTSLNIAKTGNYKFELKLVIEDSTGMKYRTYFDFTQNVIKRYNKDEGSHHGFMGMGSEMWIIMGAAMIAMMAVVLMVGSNHR